MRTEFYNLCKLQSFVGNYSKWVVVAKQLSYDDAINIAYALTQSEYADGEYKAMTDEEYEKLKGVKIIRLDI